MPQHSRSSTARRRPRRPATVSASPQGRARTGRPRRLFAAVPLVGALLLLAGTLASPAALSAQGWIEPRPDRPAIDGWAVHRVHGEVRVTVDGRVARVEVTEWFRNEGPRVAEGEYLYPLPGEAVFSGFSLFQGDEELRGEVMDRRSAREIYEEIVRRRADPALIELAGHGLLRARVFPIEAGEERKVTLRYTQLLERAGESLHFRYAGGVKVADGGPRPLWPVDDGPGRPRPAIHPERAGARHERPVLDFRMTVGDADAWLDPFSPTHALRSERRGGELVVEVDGELEGSLSIFLPPARETVGVTVAAHAPAGEDRGYFMLTLSPGTHDGPAVARDLTVVVDVSGSMSGEKIRQARSALRGLVESLSPEDRFRLVAFSNVVRPFREGWSPASGEALRHARRWIDDLRADGGTNIEGALERAFAAAPGAERLPVVVFLTDGLPTVGERRPEAIADRAEATRGRSRVFAFGVGHDVNTHLLDRLSAAARGATSYVEPGESVERALSLLATRIRHPVLTDLELAEVPVRVSEIYPLELPDVFAGQELVLFGRYEGAAEDGRLEVRGRRGGHHVRFASGAAFPRRSDANAFIPRLWASRKLGHLTRQVWTEGETESLVAEIRETALRYGLPSEYTAYLVQEPGALASLGDGEPALEEVVVTGQTFAPVAPADASGAGAVAAAARARRMRDVRSAADMEAVEMERRDGAAAGTRTVAGRLFVLRDGVWTEGRALADDDVVTVRVYSRAWFDLLEALPEIAAPARELRRVVLKGGAATLRFDDEGLETLSPGRLRALVGAFRQAPAP